MWQGRGQVWGGMGGCCGEVVREDADGDERLLAHLRFLGESL